MNQPKNRRSNVSLVVAGGVASTALAVIPVVITSAPAILGLIVGLLGVSITLLIELIIRMERQNHLTSRAQQLVDVFNKAPTIADDVEHAVETAGAVLRGGLPLYSEAVEQASAEFRQKLEELSRGDYHVKITSVALLTSQARTTKASIKATSIVTMNENWWISPAGAEYWEENVRALERGVRISRVYIFEGARSAQMTDLMAQQAKAGVSVYHIDKSVLDSELHIDVVIFDDRGVYEIEPGVRGNSKRMFKTNPVDVRIASQRFEQILQHIMQYDNSAQSYKV